MWSRKISQISSDKVKRRLAGEGGMKNRGFGQGKLRGGKGQEKKGRMKIIVMRFSLRRGLDLKQGGVLNRGQMPRYK